MTNLLKYDPLTLGNNGTKGRRDESMKKILYVLFILSMVGLILFNMVSAKDESDLFKMASILEHENVSIHKWSLHSREILETVQTKQEAERKVDQLKKTIQSLGLEYF